MPDTKHLEVLARGVFAWNAWRAEHPEEVPDLSGANLAGADLTAIDLNPVLEEKGTGAVVRMNRDVDISQVVVTPARLQNCDFSGAQLTRAELRYADMTDANLFDVRMPWSALQHAQLRRALVSMATLDGAVLQEADFREAKCSGTTFMSSWARRVDFSNADLVNANFSRALLDRARFVEASLSQARALDASIDHADFTNANLWRAEFNDARGERACFRSANLEQSHFAGSKLPHGDWTGARLGNADFSRAGLPHGRFTNASLHRTGFSHADLHGSSWSGAAVSGEPDFQGADLSSAQIDGLDLRGCDLSYCRMVGTFVSGSRLSACRVYGASVWDLEGSPAEQADLIVTPVFRSAVTVDNLEVAQFLYLLLNNQRIPGLIDTVARKCVLILGRFTPDRKAVLDAIRDELRRLDYVPVLCDFEKPDERNFTETVTILAGLSVFVLADISKPKSSPLELQATVPILQVPFVPIVRSGEEPFSMFRDLLKYDWVLQPLEYDSAKQLVDKLQTAVIDRALRKRDELRVKRETASVPLRLEDV